MKNLNLLRTVVIALLTLVLTHSVNAQKKNRQFYQIKVYSFDNDDQVIQTDNYLENAYLPALKRLDIKNIGIFKPRENSEIDSLKQIFVLIPFSSLDQFEKLQNDLSKDEKYIAAGKDYIEASFDKKPYNRIQSIILKAFSDMPVLRPTVLDGDRKDRVYELRSYESPSEAYHINKVKMFNAGGEVALFDDLGFNAVFYGEVLSGANMPNLMYMTTFNDSTSRENHWKSFSNSPVWKKLSAIPEYANNVSHIDITFLYPTEYSDY